MPLVGLSGSIVSRRRGAFPRAVAASLSGGFNLERKGRSLSLGFSLRHQNSRFKIFAMTVVAVSDTRVSFFATKAEEVGA